ncbi:hypothetical protein AHMF7605_22985 [Adhaeribacter arboris]|uniref:Outer membrane protein beta-barrel domain-containing protein n=2 Tax=Adhaeribacter arboris TaxID=2072846 RepID=A0A2T2YKX4_9BACT|nr:hypothetical protein AHMF7605_22985 [Adhaeribacter arboris]
MGIGLSNTSYHIYYKNPTTESAFIAGAVASGYFTPLALNLGYQANNRISLQFGLAYGGSKNHGFLADVYGVDYNFYSKTRVVAISITTRFIVLNAYKRFPIYATVSIMPAWGKTTLRSVENCNTVITTKSAQDAGMNLFATAGVGFNYKIWRRFTGYAEVLLVKSNLTGENSRYYDWRGESPQYIQVISSLAFGFNYNFR